MGSSAKKKRKNEKSITNEDASAARVKSSRKEAKRIKVNVRLAEKIVSADSEEQVNANPLLVPPVLVNFPHGEPRHPESLAIRCRATDSKGGQRRRRLRIAGETAHIAYSAEQPAVARKTAARYMVGVYKKSAQEVVLYPVEALVALSQNVRNRNAQGELEESLASPDKEKEVERGLNEGEEAAEYTGYADRRKSLVQTFGTKKKQRVMQSQEENRINARGVVGMNALGSFLTDSLKEVQQEMSTQAMTPAEASRAALLPPFDPHARAVERVYRPRQMLGGDEVWDSIARELEAILEEAAGRAGEGLEGGSSGEGLGGYEALAREAIVDKFQPWPPLVLELIERAPMPTPTIVKRTSWVGGEAVGGERDLRQEHMCQLLLLRHLFELYRLPPSLRGGAKGLSSALGLGDVDRTVAMVLLEHFFETEGGRGTGAEGGSYGQEGRQVRHTRTKALTDKLLLHMLVLCLVVSGFRTSATRVAEALRMSLGECTTLFRETGATVRKVFGRTEKGAGLAGGDGEEAGRPRKKGKEEAVVELLLPLKFPEIKRVIRAKK